MRKTRRKFLADTTAGVVGLVGAGTATEMAAAGLADLKIGHYTGAGQEPGQQQPAGAPPAFGTGPAVGPEVSAGTFVEAEKLVQVKLGETERAQAASSWRGNMAGLYERRTGPRKIALESTVAPFSRYASVLPGEKLAVQRDRFIRSTRDAGPLPSKDEDIAFAPVWKLSRWIETRKLSSERLTQIYLKRIEQYDPKLRCVITLTRELRSAAGEASGRGNCRGKIPRAAARDSVGRRKICWTRRGFRRRTERSRIATGFRRTTRRW